MHQFIKLKLLHVDLKINITHAYLQLKIAQENIITVWTKTHRLLNQIFKNWKSCLLALNKWQTGEMLMHWLLIEETEVTVFI